MPSMTQLRDLINSGVAEWRMTVLMETVAESEKMGYSFVACFSRMTIDHACLARRSTVFKGYSGRGSNSRPLVCEAKLMNTGSWWNLTRELHHKVHKVFM